MGWEYYTRVVVSHERNNTITPSYHTEEYGIAKCAVSGTVPGAAGISSSTVAGDKRDHREAAPRVLHDADGLLICLSHNAVAKPACRAALVDERVAQHRRRTDVPRRSAPSSAAVLLDTARHLY